MCILRDISITQLPRLLNVVSSATLVGCLSLHHRMVFFPLHLRRLHPRNQLAGHLCKVESHCDGQLLAEH